MTRSSFPVPVPAPARDSCATAYYSYSTADSRVAGPLISRARLLGHHFGCAHTAAAVFGAVRIDIAVSSERMTLRAGVCAYFVAIASGCIGALAKEQPVHQYCIVGAG